MNENPAIHSEVYIIDKISICRMYIVVVLITEKKVKQLKGPLAEE